MANVLVRAASLAIATVVLSLCACGGGGKDVQSPTEVKGAASMDAIDADPVVLLPANPALAGTFDVRALVDSKGAGAQLAALLEQYFPVGQEAGFTASRDVDRVWFGSYSTQGLDVVAVLSGRFDPEKIATVAKNHTPTKSGGVIVESSYAGRTLYTVSNVGFTVLSAKTVLAGTEGAMRRALERIKDGRLTRALFPWMMETLETKGAAFALAGDFANQPITPQSMGPISITFVKNLKAVRVLGTFEPPGLHVAGSATYADEASASDGAANLQKLATLANAFAATTGNLPTMQNLSIAPQKTDVQVTFAIDDQSLKSFLAKAPQLFGP